MHNLAYYSMKKFAEKYYNGGSVLEIGGTDINGSVRGLFNIEFGGLLSGRRGGIYATMDVTGPANYIVADPYYWEEIPPETFDYVISTSTLEHIEYPWETMRQCNRVLKVGGLVCHVAPSAGFEHKYPLDCYRYYTDGGIALLKWGRFKVLEVYTNLGNEIPDTDGGNHWRDTVMIGQKC